MRGPALLRVAALSSLDKYLSGGGLRGVDGQAGSRVRRGVRGGVAGIGDRSRRLSGRCGWRRDIVWAAIATSPCGSDSAGRAPGNDSVASCCWPRGCGVGVLQSHGVGTTLLSPDWKSVGSSTLVRMCGGATHLLGSGADGEDPRLRCSRQRAAGCRPFLFDRRLVVGTATVWIDSGRWARRGH